MGTVDTLAAIFTGDVARNRGVSTTTVDERFGQGGCLIGVDAVNAGMADAVGSLEGVLHRLTGAGASRLYPHAASAASAAEGNTFMSTTASTPTPDPADDKALAAAAKAKADDDEMAKKAKAAKDAKAAKASKKKNADPDEEDEDEEDDEDEEAKAAFLGQLRALTGKRSFAAMYGVIVAHSIASQQLRGVEAQSEIDAIVAKAKAEDKLTGPIEKQLRGIAAMGGAGIVAARNMAATLVPIKGLAPLSAQPAKPGDMTSSKGAIGLTHNGKTLAQMSGLERAALMQNDRPTFDAMLEEDRKANVT